jgi:hypothetical protein
MWALRLGVDDVFGMKRPEAAPTDELPEAARAPL